MYGVLKPVHTPDFHVISVAQLLLEEWISLIVRSP